MILTKSLNAFLNVSRKFKKYYTAFSREILREFMTEEELKTIDKKYNEAKLKRLQEKIKSEIN